MNGKIFQMIFTLFYYCLSEQSNNSPYYSVLIKGNKECKCCKIFLRNASNLINIGKSFFDKASKTSSGNITLEVESDTIISALDEGILENIAVKSAFRERHNSLNQILKEFENWNKKLTPNQMKEFQRLWISESLYPKDYHIILSKFFHDICFYKLRIKYLTDQSKKLDDLVSIISSEDLSGIISINSDDSKKKALVDLILTQPLSNKLNELMINAKNCERFNPEFLLNLRKNVFKAEADSIPLSPTDFIVNSKDISELLVDKIMMAWKIITNSEISLDIKYQFIEFIKNELKDLKSNISLITIPKLTVKNILSSIFDSSKQRELKDNLKSLFSDSNETAFAFIILIFDKFFGFFKNHQDLEKIIGNQSIFYIMLSFSGLKPKHKQLLADFFPVIAINHDFVSISKFILHFFLFPLGLTETILLVNFIKEESSNFSNYEKNFVVKACQIIQSYSPKELKYLLGREFEEKNILDLFLKSFDLNLKVKCSAGCSLIVSRNHLSQSKKQASLSQQGYEQSPTQNAFNQFSILRRNKGFNEEDINLINQLKCVIWIEEIIKGFERFLLSIETKEFFEFGEIAQKTLFYLMFSYYCSMDKFPQGHYKLCVMNFKNVPILEFQNLCVYLEDWFDAILIETEFIKTMDFTLFFDNIKFIYDCQGSSPFNFDTFLKSKNTESMKAFFSKVERYLFKNNGSLGKDTELIKSLESFKSILEKKLIEISKTANNPFSGRSANKRKRTNGNMEDSSVNIFLNYSNSISYFSQHQN